MKNELIFQWWAVDETRIMVFEYYCNASKYTPVERRWEMGGGRGESRERREQMKW